MEDSSGWVTTGSQVNWEKLIESVCEHIFTRLNGDPMVFYIWPHSKSLEEKYVLLIYEAGGEVTKSLKKGPSSTLVMVPENLGRVSYRGFTFNLKYLTDCASKNTLLDLANYIRSEPFSAPASLNIMDVVFKQGGKLPMDSEDCEDDNASESSCTIVDDAAKRPVMTERKNQRLPFSRSEKEAILKFIIARKAFSKIKGNELWKLMEDHNVCPSRTFHSLRNHMLKTLIHELDTFGFVTPSIKRMFLLSATTATS